MEELVLFLTGIVLSLTAVLTAIIGSK